MRKSYYLVFGSKRPVEELEKAIGKALDIEFVPHASDYLGQYVKYSGLYADRLSIEQNQIGAEEWKRGQFKDYPTLIFVQNTSGRNADKLSKNNHLKAGLPRMPDVTLLEEIVREEDT